MGRGFDLMVTGWRLTGKNANMITDKKTYGACTRHKYLWRYKWGPPCIRRITRCVLRLCASGSVPDSKEASNEPSVPSSDWCRSGSSIEFEGLWVRWVEGLMVTGWRLTGKNANMITDKKTYGACKRHKYLWRLTTNDGQTRTKQSYDKDWTIILAPPRQRQKPKVKTKTLRRRRRLWDTFIDREKKQNY